MRSAALLLAVFAVVIGMVGIASPDSVTRVRRLYFATPVGLYAAGVLRVGMGLVLIDSQLPTRTPCDRTLFVRAIPDANSGASKPLSVASTASFRTAVILTLTEIGPSPPASKRHAPGGHDRLRESGGPGCLAKPDDKFI